MRFIIILVLFVIFSACTTQQVRQTSSLEIINIEELTQQGLAEVSSGVEGSGYGWSINTSEKYVGIGAPHGESGSVTLYRNGTFEHLYMIIPTDASPDAHFGIDFTFKDDTLLVGAMYDSSEHKNQGAVHSYILGNSNYAVWDRLYGEKENNFFGRRVEFAPPNKWSADFIATAYGWRGHSGAFYGLKHGATLYGPSDDGEREYDQFGWDIATDGTRIFVSARSGEREGPNNHGWIYAQVAFSTEYIVHPDSLPGMRLGFDLDANDGFLAASMIPEAKDTATVKYPGGAVALWDASNITNPIYRGTISYLGGKFGDQFGHSVLVMDESILVGVPGRDLVCVYDRSLNWVGALVGPRNSRFGHALAANETGIFIGAPGIDKAYAILLKFEATLLF